jgi:two-component system, OmpR family, response regulator MprA
MSSTPIALVVDDDEDFRSALGEVLGDEGYRVIEAAHGSAAVHILGSVRPDVIFIDLLMPVMNGWSLFAAIEDRSDLRAVPVVFLSAVPHMAPGGGSLVLKKPLDLPALITLLEAVRLEPSPKEIRLKTTPRTTPHYRTADRERRR